MFVFGDELDIEGMDFDEGFAEIEDWYIHQTKD